MTRALVAVERNISTVVANRFRRKVPLTYSFIKNQKR